MQNYDINFEWLRECKYRLKIAIAIDCEIGRGRRDSDSDPDSEHDRELFSAISLSSVCE
jgi:hypothetical protein